MSQSSDIPTIYEKIRRGNAWSKQLRLMDANRVPTVLAPGTLIVMQVRALRGKTEPIVKTFTTLNNSITFDPQGLITISGWDGAGTLALTGDALFAELTIGPTELLLVAYLIFVFQLLDAGTIPVSINP